MSGAESSNSPGRVRIATPADAARVLAIYATIAESSAISFELEPPGIEEFAERMTTVMEDNPWLVMENESRLITGYADATCFGLEQLTPIRGSLRSTSTLFINAKASAGT